jgi:hypothetical protein
MLLPPRLQEQADRVNRVVLTRFLEKHPRNISNYLLEAELRAIEYRDQERQKQKDAVS